MRGAELGAALVAASIGLAGLSACGDDSAASGGAAGTGGSGAQSSSGAASASGGGGASASGGGGTGGQGACFSEAPATRDRFVVIGHGYDANGDPNGSYEVLALSDAGVLSKTGTSFTMKRPADRPIVFVPGGSIGFAVQDDGSIGVFSLDASGNATVLDPGLTGAFYADALTLSEDARTLYVVDPNFPENGGGVYPLSLGCDGSLAEQPRLVDAKNAAALLPVGGSDYALVARAAARMTAQSAAHRVSLGATATLESSVDVFGDDEASVASATLTRDGKFLLIGDNSAFSGIPNRVGVASVGPQLGAVQVLSDIEDPYALATSPHDDLALVASGFGDAIFLLDYDPAGSPPFAYRGELSYASTGPQIPGALDMVRRGALDGRVLIGDVRGLYQVQFVGGATLLDLDVFDLGGGTESIVTGVGIQP